MKRINSKIIIATVLAVAVASIIILYFKNKHDEKLLNSNEGGGNRYDESFSKGDGDCGDCGCGGCGDAGDAEEVNLLSSYNSDIVINDGNISQAASFASKIFKYKPFPFIEGDHIDWISISYGRTYDLERFIEHDKGSGKVFMSLFVQLYKNRAEYLNNGEFLRYIKLLADLIPYKTYVANGWDMMVRQLLIAYDDLKSNPSSFSQIYEHMNSRIDNTASYYNGILIFVNDKQLEAFIVKNGEGAANSYYEAGEVNQSAVVWAYSFWGRRYNENPNSIEPIVAILRLLRDELYISPTKLVNNEDNQ